MADGLRQVYREIIIWSAVFDNHLLYVSQRAVYIVVGWLVELMRMRRLEKKIIVLFNSQTITYI